MTKFSSRSRRGFRTADREATVNHIAARHRVLFFRHLAEFVAFLLRNAVVVLLFLPALVGAVAALIWNALPLFARSARRHASVNLAMILGLLGGLVLGCVCR